MPRLTNMDGLVAYYPFRKDALDYGPNAKPFTTVNASFNTNGKYSGAYNFTPAQNMRTAASLAFSLQTLTIGYWYYMDQFVDSAYNNGVATGQIGSTAAKYNYQLSVYSGGLVLGGSNGSIHENLINDLSTYGGVSSALLGKWNYISGTISGGVGTLYLNGTQVDQKTIYVPAMTSRELVVGYNTSNNHAGYSRICEVSLFNRILTPDEMKKVARGNEPAGVMSLDEHYHAKMDGDI